MTPHKRTGRQRHRLHTRLFRSPLLVLQEEWEGYVPEYYGGVVEGNIQRYWLDAPSEFLLEKFKPICPWRVSNGYHCDCLKIATERDALKEMLQHAIEHTKKGDEAYWLNKAEALIATMRYLRERNQR